MININNDEFSNDNVIYKKATNSLLLVATIDSFSFNRLRIIMGVYDKNRSQGSRLTSHVEAYIPFEKFLLFTNKVICGEYKEEQRKCTDKYHTFFSIYGGKVDNKKGTVISRSFSLVNNPDGCSFNFVGTEGAGVKKSNGMIEPVRGVKPTASISIKMNEDELKEMVLICKTYIEQYIGITLSNKLSNTAKRWNTNE